MANRAEQGLLAYVRQHHPHYLVGFGLAPLLFAAIAFGYCWTWLIPMYGIEASTVLYFTVGSALFGGLVYYAGLIAEFFEFCKGKD